MQPYISREAQEYLRQPSGKRTALIDLRHKANTLHPSAHQVLVHLDTYRIGYERRTETQIATTVAPSQLSGVLTLREGIERMVLEPTQPSLE